MPYAATMGCASCATLSIGWFKGHTKESNEAYKANPSAWTPPAAGMSFQDFFTKIIYPTRQDLGRTYDMPLEKLMQDIDKHHSGRGKLTMAVLNTDQFIQYDGYWPAELRRWGFKLVTKTSNDMGSVNYVFMRNPRVVEINDGEA